MNTISYKGRCVYHRRRVSHKEAMEKCVPRKCRYYQRSGDVVEKIQSDLDKVFKKDHFLP